MSNYYIALGIEKDADLKKIKKAYRFFCKKYHPDIATAKQKNKFLKIQKAYETLSDKEKRKEYDQSISKTDNTVPVYFVDINFWENKQEIYHRIKRFSSFIDEYFESFVPGFFEDVFSGEKELYIELILSPFEARTGGDFPIEIPVLEECNICLGRGYINVFICSTCKGSGNINTKRMINLHVPKGVSTGLATKVPLDSIGLEDVYLNVEIVVSRDIF